LSNLLSNNSVIVDLPLVAMPSRIRIFAILHLIVAEFPLLPLTATPFLPLWAADPTDLDFLNCKKRNSAGEISKTIKIQGWRGGSAFGWQTAELGLGVFLEVSSNLVV
jgi:hypothetical protein